MVGHWAYNQEVAGSILGLARPSNDSGQVVHTHVPVTKQHNLVLA